jgi:hypothetical protein
MGVGAGFGAALAARMTAARSRHHPIALPPASGLIDITDAVQSRTSP